MKVVQLTFHFIKPQNVQDKFPFQLIPHFVWWRKHPFKGVECGGVYMELELAECRSKLFNKPALNPQDLYLCPHMSSSLS